jgi:hypothetical protein
VPSVPKQPDDDPLMKAEQAQSELRASLAKVKELVRKARKALGRERRSRPPD